MAQNIEEFVPVVKYHGLNTAKDVTLAGTNTLSGATTISGALTLSSSVTGARKGFEVVTGDKTVTAAESGEVYHATKSSATQTFTLPAASTAGLTYTFICGHADGEILVNVQTGDNVSLKASEGGASVATAASTGAKNTAASNVVGDNVTLVSDGTTTWHAIAQSGTWASQ